MKILFQIPVNIRLKIGNVSGGSSPDTHKWPLFWKTKAWTKKYSLLCESIIGTFSSNVWNWNFKLSKNQLNHSIFFYLCAERRIFRECVCLMAARHRYLFLRYALLNQTTLNMQNNRYVTRYTFTFPLIPYILWQILNILRSYRIVAWLRKSLNINFKTNCK